MNDLTRTLYGYGHLDWPVVHGWAADAFTCAWADYTGFHVGDLPATPPPYSHLWGWSPDGQVLLRLRIDGPKAICGLLCAPGMLFPNPANTRPELTETVRVTLREVLTWDPDDKVIARQPLEVLPGTVRTVEVSGPFPVTFIAGPAAPATRPGTS